MGKDRTVMRLTKTNEKNRKTSPKPYRIVLAIVAFTMLSACAVSELKREVQIPKTTDPPPLSRVSEPVIPPFVPVTENISPLKTRGVDIVARNTPLRDVLHVLSETVGLNLVIEKGVVHETPVTMTLKNVTAEDALSTILKAADYFYTVKNNMLVIKAVDTKIFQFGHPPVIQNFNVELGGDILGGATEGSSSGVKGNITHGKKIDAAATSFWETIEKSIVGILGISEGAAPAGVQQTYTINRLAGIVAVTATRKKLETVEEYLGLVRKVMARQVLIEARIIEVQLSDTFNYGIDWTFLSGSVTVGTQPWNVITPDAIEAFGAGLSSSFFKSIINVLQTQGEVRTLSNPRMSIMNGQAALLTVGRNESFISKVSTTTSAGFTPTTSFTVETRSILSGVMIGILPYIDERGDISLSITPIISERVRFEPVNIGGSENRVIMKLPTMDVREMSTTVKVRDGQMVILGGLIRKKERLDDDKFPGFGDIPLIEWFFKKTDKEEVRTELVVILQPTILSR